MSEPTTPESRVRAFLDAWRSGRGHDPDEIYRFNYSPLLASDLDALLARAAVPDALEAEPWNPDVDVSCDACEEPITGAYLTVHNDCWPDDAGLREALERILAIVETLEPNRPLLAPYRQSVEAIARDALATHARRSDTEGAS